MAGTSGKGYKQTPETLAAVVDGLRSGLPPKRAAMIAGISEATYFAWRRAGWDAIEATDENSDEEMSFVVQFALQVEAAISEYMLPLIRRVSEAALSGGKGDWRAAATILQGRFPFEFSERVAVAQSQRVEVSGSIGVDIPYKRRRLDQLTAEELEDDTNLLRDRIHSALSGEGLDKEIEKHEGIVAKLRERREGDREWRTRTRGCFDSGRHLDATDVDYKVMTPTGMAHEPKKIRAAVLEAPDKAEGSGVVARPSATPSVSFQVDEPRPTTGFGFNKFGDAINLADEDLSL